MFLESNSKQLNVWKLFYFSCICKSNLWIRESTLDGYSIFLQKNRIFFLREHGFNKKFLFALKLKVIDLKFGFLHTLPTFLSTLEISKSTLQSALNDWITTAF